MRVEQLAERGAVEFRKRHQTDALHVAFHVGNFGLVIRTETPRAAFIQFDFEAGGRAGAQPCRFVNLTG